MKSIYELELHETILVEVSRQEPMQIKSCAAYPTIFQVTRVPGGWHYIDANPQCENVIQFFAPLDHEALNIIHKKLYLND